MRYRVNHYRPRYQSLKADINVTPLVDAMLVLLIIFMVTTPMMTSSVPVDLPEMSKTARSSSQAKPLVLTIDQRGTLYNDKEAITLEELVSYHLPPSQPIAIRADANVPYRYVAAVMQELHHQGMRQVSLMMQAKSTR